MLIKTLCSILLLVLTPAFSRTIDQIPLLNDRHPPALDSTKLHIKYLGAGGLFLRRGKDVVLTAPFFSNPSLKSLLFWRIKSQPKEIDRFLAPMRSELAETHAILVGHAHYDHLMDLPHILATYTPNARVYGSRTAYHTLSTTVDKSRLVMLNDQMGNIAMPGQWIEIADGRIRFMALESEHAPHFNGFKMFRGSYHKDLQRLPRRAAGWREGQTLSYLIDFLERPDGPIVYRLYYQDAASSPPSGFPPSLNRRVDLAMLCVAGYNEVGNYPQDLVNHLQPKRVAMIHWENFFSRLPEDPQDLRPVPFLNMENFVERMEPALPPGADYVLPAPGSWIKVVP